MIETLANMTELAPGELILCTGAIFVAAIVRGFAGSGFEIHFPRRFTYVMKLLRLLPSRLYFFLIRRITGD